MAQGGAKASNAALDNDAKAWWPRLPSRKSFQRILVASGASLGFAKALKAATREKAESSSGRTCLGRSVPGDQSGTNVPTQRGSLSLMHNDSHRKSQQDKKGGHPPSAKSSNIGRAPQMRRSRCHSCPSDLPGTNCEDVVEIWGRF